MFLSFEWGTRSVRIWNYLCSFLWIIYSRKRSQLNWSWERLDDLNRWISHWLMLVFQGSLCKIRTCLRFHRWKHKSGFPHTSFQYIFIDYYHLSCPRMRMLVRQQRKYFWRTLNYRINRLWVKGNLTKSLKFQRKIRDNKLYCFLEIPNHHNKFD